MLATIALAGGFAPPAGEAKAFNHATLRKRSENKEIV